MMRRMDLWLRWVALVLALGSTMALRAEAPSGWVASFETYRMGQVQKSDEPQVFEWGNARLSFTGRWVPLLRGDQQIGLYLEGKGGLDYTSFNEAEAPVFKRNLKDWMNLELGADGKAQKLAWSFTRARLLFAGARPAPWKGEAAETLEASYKAFNESWSKVDGYAPHHLFAAQGKNAPGKPLAILEMENPDQRLLYRFDSSETFTESLALVRPLKGLAEALKGWSFMLPLSTQYLGWDPRKGQAPTRFVVTGLDVDLRSEDNRTMTAVVKETLQPLQSGMSLFTFGLLSEIITEKDVRHLRVSKVTDGSGKTLEFSHTHDRLAVLLAEPAVIGTPVALTFEYAGDFLVKPGGDSYWQLGVRGAWYPQPEHMSEENYAFHSTVRTKGDWHAFMPGETVRRGKDGDWNLVETRTTQPICFATILGGKYFLDEETRDGLTVRIATYAFKAGSANKVIRDQAFNVLAYYKQFLGPYPFKELVIIQKNEWGYGQAPPGMMYITREAFEQIGNIQRSQEFADMVGQFGGRVDFSTMDVRSVLAHELAHQYWGTVVKMPTDEDQWITESFADYCAALYERDTKGDARYKRTVARWRSTAKEAHEAAPIPLANAIRRKDGYDGFRMRMGLLYAKGPMLLYGLHQELGDQVFMSWLKSIQTNFKWKFATTKRLFDLLGMISKKDQTPYYDAYFWGLAMPPDKNP